jgi:GTP-binding protein Era
LEAVLEGVLERLPEGHPYFPSDQYTDQPLRFLSAEIIREKAFQFTGEEVPYAVAVEIVSYKEDPLSPEGLVAIEANIHVERPSQKGILIGKGGQMLKRIGTAARKDLEALVGTKVFLRLWVKVTKGWRNDPKRLSNLGYR